MRQKHSKAIREG